MVDKFTIENYQIIKKGEVLFRPGITLITGPSNNGKSSIFKAYKQIIYNLSGNTYINQFADKCTLELSNDQFRIEYNKERSKSSYDITEYSGEYGNQIHIDKLGVNQIEKVKELTNIDRELDYNFWNQLEKPFLLSKTNREQFLLLQQSPISSNLMNIQDKIKVDIKTLKDDILVSQGSLNIVNTNLTKYEDILKYSDITKKLVSNMESLNEVNDKINRYNSKILEIDNINKELKKIEELSNVELKVDTESIYNKYCTFENKINNFTSISKQIKDVDTMIEDTKKELDDLEKIMNDYFSICPLCGRALDKFHNI